MMENVSCVQLKNLALDREARNQESPESLSCLSRGRQCGINIIRIPNIILAELPSSSLRTVRAAVVTDQYEASDAKCCGCRLPYVAEVRGRAIFQSTI